MMYPNNSSVPNWNSPLPGGNNSNANSTSQQIPPTYPYNYPYPSQVQVPSFPQQMAQYGPSNMSYPQNNQNGIRGRVISDISQITPNEVPMDGSVSLFPSQDYSCVYAKQWATDGTIKTMKYVPAVETQVVENQREVHPVDVLRADVMSRLDEIQGMISGLTQTNNVPTRKATPTKKEAE